MTVCMPCKHAATCWPDGLHEHNNQQLSSFCTATQQGKREKRDCLQHGETSWSPLPMFDWPSLLNNPDLMPAIILGQSPFFWFGAQWCWHKLCKIAQQNHACQLSCSGEQVAQGCSGRTRNASETQVSQCSQSFSYASSRVISCISCCQLCRSFLSLRQWYTVQRGF